MSTINTRPRSRRKATTKRIGLMMTSAEVLFATVEALLYAAECDPSLIPKATRGIVQATCDVEKLIPEKDRLRYVVAGSPSGAAAEE